VIVTQLPLYTCNLENRNLQKIHRWYCLVVFREWKYKNIRDTLETAFTSASQELTFRQMSTMEADGSVEFLDVHHCIMPNEKDGLITKDFVKVTAEHRCFISGLSHRYAQYSNQLFLGKPSECVGRMNTMKIISQLLYDFRMKLYTLASPRTWCKTWQH